jgi:hypothetical protein
MASVAAANLLVGRAWSSAAGVAALDGFDANNIEEDRLGAPETSTG